GSFSTVLPADRKATNVGCSPDSGGTVHGRLLVGQCRFCYKSLFALAIKISFWPYTRSQSRQKSSGSHTFAASAVQTAPGGLRVGKHCPIPGSRQQIESIR